jgi:hypothetical protein
MISSTEVLEHLRKFLKLAEEVRGSGADSSEYREKLDLENMLTILGENRFDLNERMQYCDPSSEEHKEKREDILQAYRGLDKDEREIRRLITKLKNINDSYCNPGPEEKEWYRGWMGLLNKYS